jgi:ribosomal protein S18 acetylase RimI-like enzyme
MSLPTLRYRIAELDDVPAVVALVNSAYRGDTSRLGWTTEADLLDGQRTDAAEVGELVTTPASLVLLCQQGEQLLGSVHLAWRDDAAYLGMFTVRPGWQGRGIGKRFLTEAERTVRERFGARCLRMTVIDRRDELIAFYQRRGYRRTGRFNPFPDDVRYGIPKVAGLRMELLEKPLLD